MKTADANVIVPVHNRASVVLDALQGVARQTLLPRKLIVVDDGSTDKTAESVTRWLREAQLPFFAELVRQPHRGVSSARNHGFAVAGSSATVAFLDSDDVWPADFLQRTYPGLMAAPDAVAVSCDRLYADICRPNRHDDLSSIADNATRWIFLNDGGIASCTLFKTRPVHELAGFDTSLRSGEDSDLFLRISLLGRWLYSSGAPVFFQHGKVQLSGEQASLSTAYTDCHRDWAIIHERFVSRGDQSALSAADRRKGMSRRWYCAGKQLMEIGRLREARQCLQRALGWRWWNHKAWGRLLRIGLLESRASIRDAPSG